MKDVNEWRSDIDLIDSQILRLLSRRTQIAIELGRLKRAHGAPLCSPERENQVLTRIIEQNYGPLATRSVHQIFRLIIRETRRAEQCAGIDSSEPSQPPAVPEPPAPAATNASAEPASSPVLPACRSQGEPQ